jgi:hypothetical protein
MPAGPAPGGREPPGSTEAQSINATLEEVKHEPQ